MADTKFDYANHTPKECIEHMRNELTSISNKELAKRMYDSKNLVYGMIDKPNIIITNGTINYDNGLCNEWNENARAIYAKDLKGLFRFGMILKDSHLCLDIQKISQGYIEYLLDKGGLKREDCFHLLYECC